MNNETMNYDIYVNEIRERISALDAVLETTEHLEDRLIRQRRRLENCLKNCCPEMPPLSWEIEQKLSHLDAWTIFAERELEKMYRQIRDRTGVSGLRIMSEEPMYFIRRSAENLGIEARLLDGKLVVKLPLLSRKFADISIENPLRTKTPYYGKMYAQEVKYVVLDALEKGPAAVKNSISSQTKCVRYYFVCDENNAIDADNYDTKAITDAVLFWFTDRDEAGDCAFYYESIFSSEKSERGTYILVSEYDAWTPGNDRKFLLSLSGSAQ